MWWAVGILAVIYFAIVSPGFRAVAIVLVLLGVGAIFLMIENDNKRSKIYDEKRRAAETAIRVDQVHVRDIMMSLGRTYDYNNSQEINFRVTVRNASNHTIKQLWFDLMVMDCRSDADCDVIGQTTAYFDDLNIPPGQVRDLKSSPSAKNVARAKSEQRFQYRVAAVTTYIRD